MEADRIKIEMFEGVEAFLARSGAFLAAHEAEHNLIFGICASLRGDLHAFGPDAPVLLVAAAGQRVVAAAVRTPPWDLVVSLVDDVAAISPLADYLAVADPQLKGINGAPDVAVALASAIARRRHCATELRLRERIYRLERLIPPRPARGRMRAAAEPDRTLLSKWLHDFNVEALPHQDPPDGDLLAERWLKTAGRTMWLWEVDEETVSLTGTGSATPNGIRVGPVYTPPARRGHGYASNLVAAATQVELAKGRRFAFLFTDLTNPTSNAIYQRIGYEPVSDALVVGLVPEST